MILCVGTTPVLQRTMTFERVSLDAVNRATSVETSTGGKALNVARALKTLGEQPLATGFLAGDSGRRIRRLLDSTEIAHDFVDVAGGDTRMCVTVIDRSAGAATELIEEPQAVSKEYWNQLRENFASLAPSAGVIVLSGSLPPGGPDDFYADCVSIAANVPVILDARGQPLRQALVHRPFVVKPNRSELAATLNVSLDSASSLRDAVRRMVDLGPRWVVVTLGADGAVAGDGEQFWKIEIPRVKVVSTIGSGDSFAAGLAAGIVRGLDMPAALRLAASCSVANTLTSQPGLIRLADLRTLQDEIRLIDVR